MTTGIMIIGIVLIMVIPASAQPGDPSQEPEVPMEGIEILVVAGGILGIGKLISSNRTLLKK